MGSYRTTRRGRKKEGRSYVALTQYLRGSSRVSRMQWGKGSCCRLCVDEAEQDRQLFFAANMRCSLGLGKFVIPDAPYETVASWGLDINTGFILKEDSNYSIPILDTLYSKWYIILLARYECRVLVDRRALIIPPNKTAIP